VKRDELTALVSRETLTALDRFVALLIRWNRTINLVGRSDEAAVWERHIADSLQLSSLLVPPPERGIDLGSGAGFPGLIVALVTGTPFDLIESDRRKAAFLRQAALVTSAPVTVHPVRIETATLSPAPLVTARALAAMPKLLGLAAPLLASGGVCLFLKGAKVEQELTDSAAQWHMRVECIPSRTAPGASILRISDLSRVVSSA
jgi:16S rRNA (guanine527-N7)-methyltransferase